MHTVRTSCILCAQIKHSATAKLHLMITYFELFAFRENANEKKQRKIQKHNKNTAAFAQLEIHFICGSSHSRHNGVDAHV